MSNNNSGKVELRDEIAKALLLEKGGITDHPSPANGHYYFYNEIEDYDTEKVIIEQRINFEEQIKNIEKLISSKVNEARIDELRLIEKAEQDEEYSNFCMDDTSNFGNYILDRIRTLKEAKLDQLSKEIE